ncbi:hypothetical protein [Hymenobacter guriensis]|uniref:Uncharacterized protein n=1 Tax=Hymenobacter guriensis TaxID=2793065 RepID=A0ABS0L0P4_9BACT|nr:hypothetical protein [Hymenobacter guriensis]MBG8553685.1 hypothetical protein [Hymenobacter guriensis]
MATPTNQNENVPASENKSAHNEQLEKEREFKEDQSNEKQSSDPSAQRNIGANGYDQRNNQKDQLENLHIGGNETTPQGGNDHGTASVSEQNQGPGFAVEGSNEMGSSIRTRDQDFGEAAPSGPAKPAHD